ncbi:MAG: 3-oxoacyl-ACP reductase FabG [Clostridia bacterium]|nr:3-oxoacyl-ACP reductase FabG [Clostridia bacterium]
MKTVLITGASRGIGGAAALEFSKKGYQVAVNYYKNRELAQELCQTIKENGGTAQPLCADVADSESVQKMVKEVWQCFGGLDVLVNNAGIALPQGLFTDFSLQDTKKVFDVNVFGMMNCCREVIPYFVKNKAGKIINLSSIWGVSGASCEAVYSASKAAIIGFTKSLARELGPSGICVNCVSPGFIDTDMNAHLSEEDKMDFANDTALGKIGKPEDVARAIVFLASGDADYITGQNLIVDGGII